MSKSLSQAADLCAFVFKMNTIKLTQNLSVSASVLGGVALQQKMLARLCMTQHGSLLLDLTTTLTFPIYFLLFSPAV